MKDTWRALGVLIALWGVMVARADNAAATITAVVPDAKGGVIRGAKVMARNRENGVERQTSTNETGAYRIGSLPPAVYDFEASFPAFKTVKEGRVLLQVGQ